MVRKLLVFALIPLLHSPAVMGEEGAESAEEKQPPAERYPCKNDPRHRAFDFWIGHWDVSNEGEHAGVNEIKPILGDCVLFENWKSAGGNYAGKSFNYYDAAEDHWRQIWVDDRGGVIEFTGEVRDGVMYYTATTHSRQDGSEIRHKLTFTPNDDGSVRQHWEQSTGGGESWQTVWDGHYVKKNQKPHH